MTTINVELARTRLEEYVAAGLAKAGAVVAHVQENQPKDLLARQSAVSFLESGNQLALTLPQREPLPLTRYAVGQVAARLKFPGSAANDTIETYGEAGADAMAYTFRRLWAKRLEREPEAAAQRVLLRAVQGRYHAMLSDRFKRIDSRPLVDGFSRSCQRVGAVPVEGHITETRISIRAIFPQVITTTHDAVVLGVGMNNSDFGAGRWSIYGYIIRLLCLNGMTGQSLIGRAHIGARLTDDDVAYSERTHRLDSATFGSATEDAVVALLGEEGRAKMTARIQKAEATPVNMAEELLRLRRALTKEELLNVTAALQSVDVEEMPMGDPNVYRLANAVSWVANKTKDADRALELQELAGNTLFRNAA